MWWHILDVGQDEADPHPPDLLAAASRGVSMRFEAPSGQRRLEGAPGREEGQVEGEEVREYPLGAAIPRSSTGDKAQAGKCPRACPHPVPTGASEARFGVE